MKLFLSLCFTAILLFASTEFEEAYLVYESGDYNSSIKLFHELVAQHNDHDAAYLLGRMYERGEGCEADEELSHAWYKVSSRGYYYQLRHQTTRSLDKEQEKLYESLQRSDDIITQNTIRQYTQSLYSLKPHAATYFLLASYKHGEPYPDTNGHPAKQLETEFQISLKFNYASNLFGFGEIYSIGYTQKSFWQLYSDSAYFRETNYNPEAFVTFPIHNIVSIDYLKAVRLSFEHQSNGRGGAQERSWNYLSSSFYFQYKAIFAEVKLWHRLPDPTDYNPDLLEYLGHGHLQFMLPYRQHLAKLLLRSSFHGKSAVEVNYSHPVFGRDDLFVYLKAFSGYAESLIDYNHKVNKIGLGFSISR